MQGNDATGQPLPGENSGIAVSHYQQLLDIQDEIASQVAIKSLKLDQAYVRERLAAGLPVLAFDDFLPGWDIVKPSLRRILDWVKTVNPAAATGLILEDIDRGASVYLDAASAWYANNPASFSAEVIALIGVCLRPFLQAYSRAVMPLVDQNLWRRGTCPVCGGFPDFSYIAREDGARWLMCWRCDSTWLFQRLACPYCGEHESSKLSYLTDNPGKYRLYICDTCQKYLKAIDLRQAPLGIRLPLERLLTFDMDEQARLMGYVKSS